MVFGLPLMIIKFLRMRESDAFIVLDGSPKLGLQSTLRSLRKSTVHSKNKGG